MLVFDLLQHSFCLSEFLQDLVRLSTHLLFELLDVRGIFLQGLQLVSQMSVFIHNLIHLFLLLEGLLLSAVDRVDLRLEPRLLFLLILDLFL